MASDCCFVNSRIPAVANKKIGVEIGVGKVENFDGGIFWAGKFGKYFPLGAWLDSSRDFWVLVSQVLLEWLPDVEK